MEIKTNSKLGRDFTTGDLKQRIDQWISEALYIDHSTVIHVTDEDLVNKIDRENISVKNQNVVMVSVAVNNTPLTTY